MFFYFIWCILLSNLHSLFGCEGALLFWKSVGCCEDFAPFFKIFRKQAVWFMVLVFITVCSNFQDFWEAV